MTGRQRKDAGPAAVDARVQAGDFDPGRQLTRLGELRKGAVWSFVGRVEAAADVQEILIDHHAGLARSELLAIGEEAVALWRLAGAILLHRHGRLEAGDRVLFAGVAASSVEDAEQAGRWIVEQIRARAPFWRKDVLTGGGSRWLNAPEAALPVDVQSETVPQVTHRETSDLEDEIR